MYIHICSFSQYELDALSRIIFFLEEPPFPGKTTLIYSMSLGKLNMFQGKTIQRASNWAWFIIM